MEESLNEHIHCSCSATKLAKRKSSTKCHTDPDSEPDSDPSPRFRTRFDITFHCHPVFKEMGNLYQKRVLFHTSTYMRPTFHTKTFSQIFHSFL